MSSPRFDIFETYAREQNSRILKASEDARLLRSISKRSEAKSKNPARKISRPRLVNVLASLIYIFKHQLA
jgi:hypothetical protein